MTIASLVALRTELLSHADNISDDLCNSIVSTVANLEDEIMAAPIQCEADAAAKLRLIADLIDDEDGEHHRESEFVHRVVVDLAAFRRAQHAAEFSGRPHPRYAA